MRALRVQCLGATDTLSRFMLLREPTATAVHLDPSFTAAEVFVMLEHPSARLVAVVRAARQRWGAHCGRDQNPRAAKSCCCGRAC